MSHTFKIKTSKRIKIEELVDELRIKRIGAYVIDRSPTFHIFENFYSTRGVDVTEESYGYEIRITFLANSNDYLLCNQIVYILCDNLNGKLIDEKGNEKYIGKLFYDLDISNNTNSDIETLFALLREGKNIDIFGPVREFSFGKRTKQRVLALQGDKHAIAYKLSKMILACQYPPENFVPFSNLLKINGNSNNEYYVQVLNNTNDIVIEKVQEYVIILGLEDNLILNSEELISILPDDWELLDEYTILAKKISEEKWIKFIHNANQINKHLL